MKGNTETVDLDRHERKILQALQADGRVSNQDLAESIGLSPSACWRHAGSWQGSFRENLPETEYTDHRARNFLLFSIFD